MKILYVCNGKDGTGWGNSSIHNILALDSVGISVVPRFIKLNNIQAEVPQRILELEKQSEKDCNVVIQHVLPWQMEYNGNFKKNIGIYYSETDHFRNSNWQYHLNLMDEVWVTCDQMKDAAIKSQVKVPIKIVPIPCDTTKYEKTYPKLKIPEIQDKFVFYFIGENQPRKNLKALVEAFYLEFNISDPVSLLLKINQPGCSPEQAGKNMLEFCNDVRKNLKLNQKSREVIISAFLSEEQLSALHQSCNCFVSPSYGESWNLEAFDSMGFGNPVIATRIGGPYDFLINGFKSNDCGWLIDYQLEPVYGMTQQFPQLYCGNEKWASIDINLLRNAMRQAYENKELYQQKREACINRRYDFAYAKVGQIMKDLLV
jgi:glycosyltransferase involved in cell wall biosynthesis